MLAFNLPAESNERNFSDTVSPEYQLKNLRKEMHESYKNLKPPLEQEFVGPCTSVSDSVVEEITEKVREVKPWPEGTTLIAGDSLIGGLDANKMSSKKSIKVRSFSGSTVLDMRDYLKPLLRKRPQKVILQIGTNDCSTLVASEILDDMRLLKASIHSMLPNCTVIFCEIPLRTDDELADRTRQEVNSLLNSISDGLCVSNSNISVVTLSKKGLHLKHSGTRMLAVNIIEFLRANF